MTSNKRKNLSEGICWKILKTNIKKTLKISKINIKKTLKINKIKIKKILKISKNNWKVSFKISLSIQYEIKNNNGKLNFSKLSPRYKIWLTSTSKNWRSKPINLKKN